MTVGRISRATAWLWYFRDDPDDDDLPAQIMADLEREFGPVEDGPPIRLLILDRTNRWDPPAHYYGMGRDER